MPPWLPLSTVATFFVLGLGLRTLLQRLRHGTFGVVLFAGDARQKARDAGLVILFTGLLAQGLVVWCRADTATLDLPLPGTRPSPWAGAIAAYGGIAVLVTAQLQLGSSWRIGIDAAARPGLVARGLYRWSRNPIFAGLLVFLFGYLLLLPTWPSLLLAAGATVGVNAQVRAEERWLLSAYGDAYVRYAARVGRFVPWLGRLGRWATGSSGS